MKKYQSGETVAGSSGNPMLYLLVGALVVALAGGAYYYNSIAASADPDAAPTERTVRMRHSEPPVFVKSEAFTVKLADAHDGRESFVQVQPDLRAIDAKAGERIKAYLPAIRHRVLLLLSSKKVADITTAEGIQRLANEIRVEANAIVDGPQPKSTVPNVSNEGSPYDSVQSVVFSSFVVQ